MQKQTAVIEQIIIRTKGEWQYFQVRIPKDAQAIIGVESTLRSSSPIPLPAVPGSLLQSLAVATPRVAGEIRFRQVGSSGLVYAGRVLETDPSLNIADVGSLDFFPSRNWSHGRKGHEDSIRLAPNSIILSGAYRDLLGLSLGQDLTYTVSVCVWYERKELQS